MNSHWSDEDLLDRLYGVGREDGHLEHCEHCLRRWQQLQLRRSEVLRQPELSQELLISQRNQIRAGLESGRRPALAFRLAPTLATLSVVVLGVVLSRPAPDPVPSLAANAYSDSQFYTEIYGMVESTEPTVAEPIYALFEE